MKNCKEKRTYDYASYYGYSMYMDVYYPENPRGDKASILTLPGGGFYDGARDDELQLKIIEMMLGKGFIVISADYRQGMRAKLRGKHSIRDISPFDLPMILKYCVDVAVEDCIAAICYICDNAEELGIDSARITLSGSSAGAITVLQTEFCRVNNVILARSLPPLWQPLAVVAFAGAVFCDIRNFKFPGTTAPLFLVHGGKDSVVFSGRQMVTPMRSFYGAERITLELLKNGGSFRTICFAHAEHEVSMLMPEMADEISNFVSCAIYGYLENEFDEYVRLESNLTEAEIERWRGKNALMLINENLQN